jgi:hypothetical protein
MRITASFAPPEGCKTLCTIVVIHINWELTMKWAAVDGLKNEPTSILFAMYPRLGTYYKEAHPVLCTNTSIWLSIFKSFDENSRDSRVGIR